MPKAKNSTLSSSQPSSNHKKLPDSTEFSKLFINKHFRYHPNGEKIGCALITINQKGKKIAHQWDIPQGKDDPQIRRLTNIETIHPSGMTNYQARADSPTRSPMYATRFIDLEHTHDKKTEKMQLAFFENDQPLSQSSKEIPIFRPKLTSEEEQIINKKLGKNTLLKGNCELTVDPESVIKREKMARKPDQYKVMGKTTAEDAFRLLYEMKNMLSDEMLILMKTAFPEELEKIDFNEKNKKQKYKKGEINYQAEWGHAEAAGLTPLTINPQRQNNLGAMFRCNNTQMMVLEDLAKWIALNRPNSWVRIKPLFEMVRESHIVKKINYEVNINDNNQQVKISQQIDVFKYQAISRPSDLAQSTCIVNHLLNQEAPISTQPVLEKFSAISTKTSAKKSPTKNNKPNGNKFFNNHKRNLPPLPVFDKPSLKKLKLGQ